MAQIAGNLQRIKNGQRRYAITPRIPAGFIQPDQLQKYIDVANKFGAVLKLTGSQRIMITNLKAEDVDKAWEMLGGIPCNGICAYVNDTATFETSTEYSYLIEKSIENFYRVFSKKMSSLPSSSMAVRENVMQPKAIRLTPQESEQLSEYESYVRQQKEDIQELSQMFKAMLGDDAGQKEEEPYIQEFKEAFQPIPNVALSFQWELTDIQKKLVFEIDNGVLNCYYGEKEDADVEIRSTKQILEKVIHGEAPLQTAFMGGELTAKGNFRVLHTFDSLFRFR